MILRSKLPFLLSLATAIAIACYIERFDLKSALIAMGIAIVIGIPFAYVVSQWLAPWFATRSPSRLRCLLYCLGAHLLLGGIFWSCIYIANDVIPWTISWLMFVNFGLWVGGAIGLALVLASFVGCLSHLILIHGLDGR